MITLIYFKWNLLTQAIDQTMNSQRHSIPCPHIRDMERHLGVFWRKNNLEFPLYMFVEEYISCLAQDWDNSIANALELP